ncbi:MAG: serine hydrolase [Anaerolineae bacterium]|nr:serine hydrolase [Anaerolineae bacterium]
MQRGVMMMVTTDKNDLQRATPESQGIASAAILQFVETVEKQIHELHSFILLRHGKVVAEGWWSPYGREYPHLLFSLSKSFTSTAVGLAIAEGHFSLDDTVISFFPDDAPAEINEHLEAMRVRHLLTMSTGSGQFEDTWRSMVERSDGNWIKGFFEVPIDHEPGTHFVYNTGATYMLSAIVQKTTGMKVVDYLESRLFEPLGIEKATWTESPQGITAGGIGLSLKTEDVARFGQLYLQKGMWQGQQILLEAWVEEATGFRIDNSKHPNADWAQGYGYQFWRCRHNAYRGDGVFGQFCIVMPEQDAVLAITAGIDVFDSQQPLDLIWEMLLPAMRPDSLAEDAAVQNTLTQKLSSLSLLPTQGHVISPVAAQVSGQVYRVDANALKIETIALNFSESGCTLNIKTAAGEETIPCGYGAWHRGEAALFNQPLLFNRTPVAASGEWIDEDTFTIVVRLYETPFYHTLVCNFGGDEMMVEIQVNISMDSMKPLLLTARFASLIST